MLLRWRGASLRSFGHDPVSAVENDGLSVSFVTVYVRANAESNTREVLCVSFSSLGAACGVFVLVPLVRDRILTFESLLTS